MPPHHPAPKSKPNGIMMGSNADSKDASNLKGFNYKPTKGGPGKWINRNGTQVGESDQEDSTIRNKKSTGDTIAPRTYKYDAASYKGPPDETTRNFRGGTVRNANGKVVGYGTNPRSGPSGDQAGKSTGDRPTTNITPMMKAAKAKRKSNLQKITGALGSATDYVGLTEPKDNSAKLIRRNPNGKARMGKGGY